MNTANKLTLCRVVMIPIFIVLLYLEFAGHLWVALAVFILASVTDFVDGYEARHYDQVTDFGKFMDPLADKLLVCAALICFLADPQTNMPAWVVIIIISREFIISGFRLVAAEKGVTIAASYWGKFKTTFQMLMVIVLILNVQMPFFQILGKILTYAALILTVVSLIDYIVKNKDVLKEQN